MMTPDIKLKRLCQRPGLASLIQQFNSTQSNDSLCIADHQQNPILGNGYQPDNGVPVRLNEQTILGWVSGSGPIQIIADLLVYAAQNEQQSKALAQETLAKYKELTLLYELSEKIAACVEVSQLSKLALQETARLIAHSEKLHIAVALNDSQSQQLLIHNAEGELFAGQTLLEPLDGISASVLEQGNAEIVNDLKLDQRYQLQPGRLQTAESLMTIALRSNERIYGLILVISETPVSFQAAELKVLNVLASQIAMALGRAELISNIVEQELLQESLKLSRDIQMGMLSTDFPRFSADCPLDLFAYMLPAKEVGGDFYDFFYLNPGTLLITIGDVSGKGVPAALFMVMVKTLIRAIARHESSPARILELLNHELCRDNDSAMFVTLFIATLDIRSGQLIYSFGGHNPPVVLGQNGTAEYLQGNTGTALGILDGFSYIEEAIVLARGDGIVLYTDGVTEAMNIDYQLFDEARLLEQLLDCAAANAETLTQRILDAVSGFAGEAEQSDDITLLSLRFGAP